jgi:hypothetical protein
MTISGFFYLRVLPHTSYRPVSSGLSDSQQLRRTVSEEGKHRAGPKGLDVEPGKLSTACSAPTPSAPAQVNGLVADVGTAAAAAPESSQFQGVGGEEYHRHQHHPDDVEAALPSAAMDEPEDATETSSLMSRTSSLPGEVLLQNSVDLDRSHRVDIRGWRLLRSLEFWQLFSIMGILAGIGLMTIK